jgi:hypothetical protein
MCRGRVPGRLTVTLGMLGPIVAALAERAQTGVSMRIWLCHSDAPDVSQCTVRPKNSLADKELLVGVVDIAVPDTPVSQDLYLALLM